MHHPLEADLIVLWLVAIVLAFAFFMAWGFSIHDDRWEDNIGCAIPPIILLAALVITILQVIGVIGVW